MKQEEIFVKELSALVRLGKNQGNQLSSEQIKEAFVQSGIAEDKMPFIHEYLQKNQIRIDDEFDPEEALSEDDRDFLGMFMEELEGLPAISDAEKEALIVRAIEDDLEAQQKLVEVYLPKVVEIAKLYVGQNVLLEDLIGEGNVALTAAVSMAGCIDKAEDADGYIAKMIMDAMEVLISAESDEKEADAKILERVVQVADAAEELYRDMRRKVTPAELAAETDFSEDEIIQAYKWSGKQIDTLDIGEDDNGTGISG